MRKDLPGSGGQKLKRQKRRQILGLFLVLIVLSVFMNPQLQSFYSLQEKQRVSVGEPLEIQAKLHPLLLKVINVHIRDGETLLALEGETLKQGSFDLAINSPVVVKPGNVNLELKLFNLIPIKKISVNVVPDIRLIPGGHSIGVLLRTEGVMVVGYSPILNQQNEPCFPARDADIKVGDMITGVNGKEVLTDDQVRTLIKEIGQSDKGITLTINRQGKVCKKIVYPRYCNDTKSYRIGLFVRDNAGGVGTLTFCDPVSKKYGALGHVITDGKTNQKLNIRQGKILSASIENIQKGKIGSPGEKVGIFLENTEFGDIQKNEMCGIYGTLKNNLVNTFYHQPLPVLYSNQIRTGKAQILTVVRGQEIKKYDILIEKILYSRTDGKNMIIRIIDKELLEKTGGIVQGMSGSPIIQDNKLVGAVTHVFVNDPSRGYAVFIENMLLEAGVIDKEKQILRRTSQNLLFFLYIYYQCI